MNYREKIRKAIECPQFGNKTYGKWGIMNLEQRKFIKRLLDDLDRADNYIKKVYLENKKLKDNWNKLKECLKEVMNRSNGADKDFVETILNIMQEVEQGSDSNVKD